MVQPHDEVPTRPDIRGITLFSVTLITGTLYLVGLGAHAFGMTVPEPLADLVRAATVTCAVSLFIRSGFQRMTDRLERHGGDESTAYALGYADGVARRPPREREHLQSVN